MRFTKKKLIKADSLFCRNPVIKLDLHLQKQQTGKTSVPNLDTIIQQLTGDLSLGYIGVTNASIKINTYQGDTPSSFNSYNNNLCQACIKWLH